MTSSAEKIRAYSGPALFSFGFRPFFLGGAIVATVVPLLTAAALSGWMTFDSPYGAVAWHGHEMMFGFVAAVVAGFLTTAVPNWTGRLPVVGAPLAAMTALWLAGRAAMASAGSIGAIPAAIIDTGFLFVLSAVIWREIVQGRNWRNLPVAILLTLLATVNAAWHLAAPSGVQEWALRAGAGVIAGLIALIGGRITPSFTRNWLKKTGKPLIADGVWRRDPLAHGAIGLALACWIFAPQAFLTAALAATAAGLHAWRLRRWGSSDAYKEPLVAILHVGYAWLPIGLVLISISAIKPDLIPPMSAFHGLTAGAMGVMTLAVMTRATLGHTGRALEADRATVLIYALVNVGALVRVAAPIAPVDYASAAGAAAVVWSAAFALFVLVYGRYLLAPRRVP